MATTRSRPRGREHARPSTGGVATEHATKIYWVAIPSIVVIIAFLALTSIGHVIDAATQHFMLYYAGVFALIAMCASVGFGLVATDRMFMNPGHRVFIQAAHRAASFGAVAFLIIHIVTEILAQRVHVLDAVIPFLSPFRTFYIGLGTISSDLIILLLITGIMRGRFTANGKAWRWRAIHYTSYVAFVFGVWHGLLGGRPGKPYVDWSYGFVVAFVLVGLAVRILSNSLRPKENLSAPPVSMAASSASAPFRAAAMFAQLGAASRGRQTGPLMVPSTVVGAQVGGARTGGMPMLPASAPAGAVGDGGRQPFYEPGYDGPPRYLGAPSSPPRGPASGPMPRAGTGPMPQATTGPMPTGPMPAPGSGPMPRPATGPIPRGATGPMPRAASGPMPRAGSGPMPRPASGPMMPPHPSGPMPRAGAGPMPRPASGPIMPPHPSGPLPRAGSGPMPRPAPGPMPRGASGPRRGPAGGPVPPPGGGPRPDRGWQQGRGGQPQDDWNGGGYDRSYDAPDRSYDPRQRSYDGYGRDEYDRSYDGYGRDEYDSSYGSYEPAYEPSYEAYEAQTSWDGGLPEPDPRLKYREPGPGMPGYRGGRDNRYGGDRR